MFEIIKKQSNFFCFLHSRQRSGAIDSAWKAFSDQALLHASDYSNNIDQV